MSVLSNNFTQQIHLLFVLRHYLLQVVPLNTLLDTLHSRLLELLLPSLHHVLLNIQIPQLQSIVLNLLLESTDQGIHLLLSLPR
jgi:hypothetical protein